MKRHILINGANVAYEYEDNRQINDAEIENIAWQITQSVKADSLHEGKGEWEIVTISILDIRKLVSASKNLYSFTRDLLLEHGNTQDIKEMDELNELLFSTFKQYLVG